MKNALQITLFLAVLAGAFLIGRYCTPEMVITKTDTLSVTRIDTVRITELRYIKEKVIDTINVPVTDTIKINDTLFIQLPVSQKYYSEPTFKAWVSGYKPKLDSIEVYQKTITNTVNNYIKPPRFTVTAGVGVGVSRNGLEPFIGIVAGYRIF